jgi:chloramphenicol 3-O phosphotransferase
VAHIVILNGAAGAGKTSIVRAWQELNEEPFLDAGIDRFLRMLPARYLEPPLWADVMGQHDRAGAAGRQLMGAMHATIAAIARSGLSVVADHVIVDRAWLAECARLFRGLDAYLVGIMCPLDVLERRERERPDRQATAGEVARQFEAVHAHAAYDVEVDTSVLSPAGAAAAIRDHVDRYPPRALRLLELFEGAPSFVRRLLAEPSVGPLDELLDRAERVAVEMPEDEQIELLNAHPRIGAAPPSVSALSYREQGYDRDPGTAELQARLDRLNDEYERRHGFRFVVFVAGRPRNEIAHRMEELVGAPRDAEMWRGLRDVIAIAHDRANKLSQEDPT